MNLDLDRAANQKKKAFAPDVSFGTPKSIQFVIMALTPHRKYTHTLQSSIYDFSIVNCEQNHKISNMLKM